VLPAFVKAIDIGNQSENENGHHREYLKCVRLGKFKLKVSPAGGVPCTSGASDV
jgi:hypothetical protein